MTYILHAQSNKPVGFWPMGDNSPFDDYSGYNRPASSGANPARHLSLMNGSDYSSVLNNSAVAQFQSPVFLRGYESRSFTIEAIIRVLPTSNPGAPQQILGHGLEYDGLVIDGNKISFVTKYETSGEARAEFELDTARRVHIVGVHTDRKNSLFIDGVLVSEVDITSEQQLDSFSHTNDSLYSGESVSDWSIAVSGIGIYSYAIGGEEILDNFNVAKNVVTSSDIASGHGGEVIDVSALNMDQFLSQNWSTAEQWSAGYIHNIVVQEDRIIPQETNDESLLGTWEDVFLLSIAGTTSIYGIVPFWEGAGATVEFSIDGTAWETAVNGRRLDIIPPGFDPTDEILQIRVTFGGGIVNDQSYLSNLEIIGITDNVSYPSVGRTVTHDNTSPLKTGHAQLLSEVVGVDIDSTGEISISPDTTQEAIPARTVELLIKNTGTSTPTISVSGATYVNGQPGSLTLPIGQWSLVHIVASSNVTGNISVSGPAQLGSVVIYSDAKSSSEVAQIYSEYVGTKVIRVSDQTFVNMAESATEPKIYAHDWSIQSAG